MTAKYQFLKPSPWRGINKAPSALGYTTVSLILGWRERRRFWVKAFEHEREQRAYTQKLHSFAPHSQVFSPGTMEKSEQKLLFRSPLSFSFHLSDLAWKKRMKSRFWKYQTIRNQSTGKIEERLSEKWWYENWAFRDGGVKRRRVFQSHSPRSSRLSKSG